MTNNKLIYIFYDFYVVVQSSLDRYPLNGKRGKYKTALLQFYL